MDGKQIAYMADAKRTGPMRRGKLSLKDAIFSLFPLNRR
jgi:hypothetical protein